MLIFFVALAYHPTPPELLLVEEPDSGVHPGRLADIMRLLREITQGKHGDRGAQVVLTTHSPYLLDLVDIEQDQVLVFRRNDDGTRTAEAVDAKRLELFLDEFKLGEVWFNQGEAGRATGRGGATSARADHPRNPARPVLCSLAASFRKRIRSQAGLRPPLGHRRRGGRNGRRGRLGQGPKGTPARCPARRT